MLVEGVYVKTVVEIAIFVSAEKLLEKLTLILIRTTRVEIEVISKL